MKRNIFLLIFVIILTLAALAIALPTISFKYNGNDYTVRGIDPTDFGFQFVSEHFGFSPSIDLQGGNLITLSVNLASVDEDKRATEVDTIKSIIYWRLWNAHITNFQLNSLSVPNSSVYRFLIKVPEEIDKNLIELILSPGHFSVWVEDPTATDNIDTQNDVFRQIFGNRAAVNLTNEDVQNVRTISDSRCYYSDPTQPNNYCLQITFTSEGQAKLASSIIAAGNMSLPIVIALDYSPVGVQAGGQYISSNVSDLGRELIIYPLTEDKYLINSIMASMIGSTPISQTLSVESSQKFSPILGDNTLTYMKVSLALAFVAVCALVLYYFRDRGRLFVVNFTIFIIWSIAVLKILGVSLDFYLLSGFVISTLLFIALMIASEYKIRAAYKGNLTSDEMKEVYSAISIKVRNLTVATLVIDFLMGFYGTTVSINYMTGFGAGMIMVLFTVILAFKALMPYMLLNKKNEKIKK